MAAFICVPYPLAFVLVDTLPPIGLVGRDAHAVEPGS
jgi:hypothetical protein